MHFVAYLFFSGYIVQDPNQILCIIHSGKGFPLKVGTSLSYFYLLRVFVVVLFDDLLSLITFLSINVERVIYCSSGNLPVAV